MDLFEQLLETGAAPDPKGNYGGMRVLAIKRIPNGDGTYREQTLINAGGSAPHNPASTTKLMTAYLTFQAIHKKEMPPTITVSDNAMRQNESPNYLKARVLEAGDTLPSKAIVLATTVGSDNVAAGAIAETLGNGYSAADRHHEFVEQMNAAAKKIGMTSTHFINASGMNLNRKRDAATTEATTTAADMAILIARIYDEFPNEAREYFEQTGFRYGRLYHHKPPNHRLNDPTSPSYILDLPSLRVGTKTGWISLSKHNSVNLVNASDGSQLVVVALGAESMPEAKALTLVRKEDLPDKQNPNHQYNFDAIGIKGSKIRDALVERIVRHFILVSGEERDISTFRFAGEEFPKFPVSLQPTAPQAPALPRSVNPQQRH